MLYRFSEKKNYRENGKMSCQRDLNEIPSSRLVIRPKITGPKLNIIFTKYQQHYIMVAIKVSKMSYHSELNIIEFWNFENIFIFYLITIVYMDLITLSAGNRYFDRRMSTSQFFVLVSTICRSDLPRKSAAVVLLNDIFSLIGFFSLHRVNGSSVRQFVTRTGWIHRLICVV